MSEPYALTVTMLAGERKILRLAPSFRGELRDLPVGHLRQVSQHLAQITVRVKTAAVAALNHCVEDCAAVSGSGISHEEPVLLT